MVIVKKLELPQYICKIFFKDLKNEHDDFKDIWERIKSYASLQSQWEKHVPTGWIEMERNLQQLANAKNHSKVKGEPVIKYKDLMQMAPSTFPSPDLFVKYMQTSGLLLMLDVDHLSPGDDIVIDTQWIIDAFKQVIDFNSTGSFDEEKAKEIWKDGRFLGKVSVLLNFMERLGLIAKPLAGNFYYIPSLLEEESPSAMIRGYLESKKKFVSKTLVLDYRKDNKQIPFPHFDKLMAEIICRQSEEEIFEFKRQFCIIEKYPKGYIVCHGSSIIKITLFLMEEANEESKEKMLKGKFGNYIQSEILQFSKDIARKFKQRMQLDPVKGLSCNPYPSLGQANVSYIKFETLRHKPNDKLSCCKSTECKRVEAMDYAVWQGKEHYIIHYPKCAYGPYC